MISILFPLLISLFEKLEGLQRLSGSGNLVVSLYTLFTDEFGSGTGSTDIFTPSSEEEETILIVTSSQSVRLV